MLKHWRRSTNKTVILLSIFAFLIISISLLHIGYEPQDDALRHVAKVVSGKTWQEVLVIRPEITMDSHPGWHWVLGVIQSVTGCDKKTLLDISVVSLFLLFTVTPLFFFSRAEAWIISLAFTYFSVPYFIMRTLYGRPLIVSMVVVMLFCYLSTREQYDKSPKVMPYIAYSVAIALATWIHGTWYLFVLPLTSLAIAQEWKKLKWFSAATAIGVIIGACLTMQPLTYLFQTTMHVLNAFGNHTDSKQLVTEFRPGSLTGQMVSLAGAAIFIFWIVFNRIKNLNNLIRSHVFYLIIMTWALGFFSSRFWTDWGVPAFMVWIGMHADTVLKTSTSQLSSPRRVLIAVLLCALLGGNLAIESGRWVKQYKSCQNLDIAPIRKTCGNDGIIYNTSMQLFYRLMYLCPTTTWKYMVGFEPTWMPPEDLATFRDIQLHPMDGRAYSPWVKKMTEKDCLLIKQKEAPVVDGITWTKLDSSVWVGKGKEP